MQRSIVWGLAVFVAGFAVVPQSVLACPFCSAVSQTLRQEMATMDVVVIAEAIPGAERDADTGEVPLKVVSILKGEEHIKVDTVVRTVYYGGVEPGRRFMLSGVEPGELLWSSPLPVDKRAEEYLVKVTQLPDDDLARLRFYQQYLQDESTMLARDAYDEFAVTPYTSVLKLKDDMNHAQLVEWIQDPEMPADRRRLYLVMLGVCGSEKDVPMLEGMLRSSEPSARSGLDSLIACYMTLGGKESLALVNELFLANKKAPYADTYAAIMAIRFHGTETTIIPRAELVTALHSVLERADLADLVIPDLARWGDWTQIDRLVKLFEAAEADNNWIRVPVINYMRACPLPEAAVALEKLKAIDPEAVKRANTFFTAPVPPPENPPTSSMRETKPSGAGEAIVATEIAKPKVVRASIAPAIDVQKKLEGANPVERLSVLGTLVLTLMLAAYLVLSGGPQPAKVATR